MYNISLEFIYLYNLLFFFNGHIRKTLCEEL